jgi:DNA polymerase-3 subunit epsilon
MQYNVNRFAEFPLYGLPVAVFDFETTGIDPTDCRAIELAIVHLNLGHNNAEVVFNERFNPGIPIPDEAAMIHGIGDSQVQDCSFFWDFWPEIDGLLRDRVLAAYNLPYDWTLLNAEYRRNVSWQPTAHQHTSYGNQLFGICGLVMARAMDSDLRGKGSHRLGAVCGRRDIEISQEHSAIGDTLASAQLIETLMSEIRQERQERFATLRDFWAWQKMKAIEQEFGLRQWLLKKGIKNDVWPWTDY